MKLSAILPLPVSVTRCPASVLTPVAGEPVLVRIVRALTAAAGDVLVPTGAALIDEVRRCLDGTAAQVINAGESPGVADCLAAATAHLQAAAATHVLIAHHRYPVIAGALVERVTEALAAGAELVIPVLPVTDTVKSVDGQGTIRSTVDRTELRITQYPYGVAVSRLVDLDTALGAAPVTVAGDADAIPFDLPADAALLAAVIACRR